MLNVNLFSHNAFEVKLQILETICFILIKPGPSHDICGGRTKNHLHIFVLFVFINYLYAFLSLVVNTLAFCASGPGFDFQWGVKNFDVDPSS